MPTKPRKKLHLINVRVDDETRHELRRLAAKANLPVSNYGATLIMEHLSTIRVEKLEEKKITPHRPVMATFKQLYV